MSCVATSDPAEGYFHAVIDSDVFTFHSRKTSNFPTIPPRNQNLNPNYKALSLPNFNNPAWASESVPFLGFFPSCNPFKCAFLHHLDYSFDMIPIEEWDSLERHMQVFLMACMKVNQLPTPRGFHLWSYPAYFGYLRKWTTEFSARHAAFRSHQAFLPLIASISFFLHMLYSVGNKWEKLILDKQVHATLPDYSPFWSDRQNELLRLRQDPAPSRWDWETQLQKESSLSWEWLSFFKDHVLTLPMVGLFLDATTDSGCLGLLPVFLEAPMPVVIYWGHSKDWSTSKDIVNVLVSRQAPYSSQQIPTVTSPSAVKQIPAATAPSTVS
ncbi:hypothetical protein BT96DRAFT_1005592 [Gymnopus androsaceus JB14]|uniref:Uncharacterized protein n=1 Tax=Gymnopus androsaceus JB14 TaxID=1447944 RepID=A0A6A4GP00_9AGAR|nr:hypothetical protein BT96DRAFT_1005592 [Gymnopus androsaceus JB14]